MNGMVTIGGSTPVDGSMVGLALVATIGLVLLCLGQATRHNGRFYDRLVRHVEAQRRLRRQPPLPPARYERDRRPIGLGFLAGGWLVLFLGLFPLIDTVLRP
jgi:hypothetical protein